eukprot:2947395-Heterocapsa_arctica.AAC.1
MGIFAQGYRPGGRSMHSPTFTAPPSCFQALGGRLETQIRVRRRAGQHPATIYASLQRLRLHLQQHLPGVPGSLVAASHA